MSMPPVRSGSATARSAPPRSRASGRGRSGASGGNHQLRSSNTQLNPAGSPVGSSSRPHTSATVPASVTASVRPRATRPSRATARSGSSAVKAIHPRALSWTGAKTPSTASIAALGSGTASGAPAGSPNGQSGSRVRATSNAGSSARTSPSSSGAMSALPRPRVARSSNRRSVADSGATSTNSSMARYPHSVRARSSPVHWVTSVVTVSSSSTLGTDPTAGSWWTSATNPAPRTWGIMNIAWFTPDRRP